MKYKVFDVIELKNRDKATILEVIDENKYKVEIVDNEGNSKCITEISKDDISKIIHKK